MKITILAVGKIKEKYLRDGISEYTKRLSRYCKLELVEVSDEKTPDKLSETLNTQIRRTEGNRLFRYIREDDYVISLDIDGAMPDSVELSHQIEALGVQGISHIIFLIGGSLGLSDEIRERADFSLSFSKMTFPHQLMRMILLEQIYRSYRIMHHEPYHK
ncbi:23S rRNA (pseudouridine(1915)-N(3))-methyltransferase RlmH [Novisyntrophococcus fermenticellae]|uniref:23S rRNA (pseudouridine(1915)-N(3))-methyltransferase RlmH n=1 Tax=Novisyntrophococcus fermenticellae TaxID=2068655 RepID=UPI001E34C0D2|nr:23S rRNA (pseudouridine(1915)-N(3))-methyltransferase RlmH [Novisyntrophococcus fermenticellae]